MLRTSRPVVVGKRGDPAGAHAGRAGRADARDRAAARRNRIGQGSDGAGDSRPEPASSAADDPRELRGDSDGAHRERAVRPRAGRVHRRAVAADRPLRSRAISRRSSSTRSASCRWRCRSSCCACSRSGSSNASGSTQPIKVDVRIIAATNRNLEDAVRDKTFREDLFYRLNVFPVVVPPLRERVEDIPALVWSFVDEFSRSFGKTIDSIPKDCMRELQRYPWPGNVRELRNVIERAVIVATGRQLVVWPPRGRATAGAAGRHDAVRAGGRATSSAVLDSTELAHSRRRRRGRASGPQADDAREPDGAARHHAKKTGLTARSSGRRRRRIGAGQRHAGADGCSRARSRLDDQVAADQAPRVSRMPISPTRGRSGRRRRSKPTPGVHDLETNFFRNSAQRDVARPHAGVRDRVRHGFLQRHGTSDSATSIRQAVRNAVVAERDVHVLPRSTLPGRRRADAAREAQVVQLRGCSRCESAWMSLASWSVRSDNSRMRVRASSGRSGSALLEGVEVHRQDRHPLADVVVKLAGDSRAIGFVRLDQTRARRSPPRCVSSSRRTMIRVLAQRIGDTSAGRRALRCTAMTRSVGSRVFTT